jgi:hypothetical protein
MYPSPGTLLDSMLTELPRESWERARNDYLARVEPWAVDRLQRMSRQQKHPVYDFLFEYYSFRPAHLLRWSPGFGIRLVGARRQEVAWPEFTDDGSGLSLLPTAFPSHRKSYLHWAAVYLAAVRQREPSFACSGLHEWAMVYRDPNVRHPYVPLRLPREEIDAVVESLPLRCSHYDAYRFFTPDAVPRNRWELSRMSTTEHDQSGCLHANMDLYKFAYKIAPFCPYDLLADAFDTARAAREIDMRASPYDLTRYGFAPIKIETTEGRAEYAEAQREVQQQADPVRRRLLEVYRQLAVAA